MPFINVNLFQKTPPARLHAVVEKLLIVSCSEIITLNAIIFGDVTGHTFEWVQATGSEVTWIGSRFDFTAMFYQTEVRNDKVFKFYIDRGTPNELVYELLVTAIPIDVMSAGLLPDDLELAYNQISNVDLNYQVPTSPKIFPDLEADGTATVNGSDYTLYFSRPAQGDFLVGFVVQQYINGAWVNVATLSRDENMFTGAVIDATYRVIAYYNEQNKELVAEVTLPGSKPSRLASEYDVSVTDTVWASCHLNEAALIILDVLQREIINQDFGEESAQVANSSAEQGLQFILDVIQRELKQYDVNNETGIDDSCVVCSSDVGLGLMTKTVNTIDLGSVG